jgi:hypothetical protein
VSREIIGRENRTMSATGAFPAFDALFLRGVESSVPLYLALVTPGPHLDEAVRALRAAERAAGPRLEGEIAAMLAAADWRPQIVGAASVVALGANASRLAALWGAVERPSWVSPQLAAAASLADPAFGVQSRRVIESALAAALVPAAEIAWNNRHSALGGESDEAHLDKRVAALVRLNEARSIRPDWIDALLGREDVQACLARDRAGGGAIATRWEAGMRPAGRALS